MANAAVSKGKRGERELALLLGEYLGDIVVADPHGNGSDIQAIPGLAIEVKRQETLNVRMWWAQATRQAESLNRIPVLAYRQNRQREWTFCLPAYCLTLRDTKKERWITLQQPTFLIWLREWLAD